MIPSIVLNLDRCPERLSWFFEQANKIGLNVKKVAATDVNNPNIRHYIDEIISDKSPLSKSEIACLMTHRDVWQGLLNSDQEAIAIFEDDVCLGFDLINLLDKELPSINFDLIRLETYLTRVSLSRRIYSTIGKVQLRKLLTTAYGSAAYVISKRAARYFLEYTDKFQHPVDLALFGITSLKQNKICVLHAVPAVCVQQDRTAPPLFNSDHGFS